MRLTISATLLLATAPLCAFAQNTIPTDAKPTCAVTSDEFAGWIADENGGNRVFNPPASFDSAFNNDCDFYKWGSQMFLWLTSPSENGWVFDDTGFYDVVHSGAGTEKIASVEFVKNGPGLPNKFVLRSVKGDSQGGAGQAGGNDVLISQNGALTFYGMHVNDAYAAFVNATLAKPQDFNFTDTTNAQDKLFPTTKDDMQAIVDFGTDQGIVTENATVAVNAGTLELKTSWVPADTVDGDFITITAQVPTFTPNDDNTLWTQGAPEQMELAMVGMHIAGPVVGHPELVWASFEHLGNGPMNAFVYTNSDGDTTTVPYDGSGTWTFAQDGATLPDLVEATAVVNGDGNIAALGSNTVSAVNAIQMNPWGNSPGSAGDVDSNTDLISLNASLIALLENDPSMRARYYQLGAIWTDGSLPVYPSVENQFGGLMLANSTMETFHQFGAQVVSESGFKPQNCLACHGVSGPTGAPQYNNGTNVSHIFLGASAVETGD